jgi:hypothetical protein
VALAFERIRRHRQLATDVIAIEPGPVDLGAAAVQRAERFEDPGPVHPHLAQRWQEGCVVRYASSRKP